jgi:integrase
MTSTTKAPTKRRKAGQITRRVNQYGKVTWILRVFLGRDGKGKRLYHGTTFEGSATGARRELTKMLSDVDTKTLVRPSQQTLKSFIKEWLKSKASVSDTTRDSYEYQLTQYVYPTLGHLKLSDINAPTIQRLYNAIRDQGLSPRTIEYTHALLSQALKKAVKLGLLGRNPADDTERPTKAARAFTILSAKQMVKLEESERGRRFYPLWVLLLSTGLRPGEALALRWADFEEDTVHVRRVLTRTLKGAYHIVENRAKTPQSLRAVTLPPSTVEALKVHRQRQVEEMLASGEHYQRKDFMFATALGAHYDLNNVRTHWKSALKRAGLPKNIRLYDTRHSHATMLLNEGNVNLAWVAARLGHTSVTTTERVYTRVLPEAHKQMADTMQGIKDRAEEEARKKKTGK